MTSTDVEPVAGSAEAQRRPRLEGARLARLGLLAAMVSRVVGRLVGIVLVVVLAREAAPATVAVYGYLLGTATLLLTLTDLGVAAVAGREVAAGRMPADGALAAALVPQLFSVLAAGAVTVALVLLAGPAGTPASALWMVLPYVLVGGLNNLWADVLRGTGRVMLEGALQVGSTVVLVAAGVVVVQLGGSATALLAVVVAKEVAVLAIAVAVVPPRRRPEVRVRTLIRQGAWVGVASSAIVLLWREGALVVGAAGSLTALATYVVATRFFDAGVTVAHTVGFGLTPGMSALADDPAAFRRAARKYLGLITALGLAVAVAGALLAGPLTTIPFGARWAGAVPAVRMVAVSAFPLLLIYLCFAILMAREQVRWLSVSCGAASSVGLGATIGLVRHSPAAVSGVVGTLIGTAVLLVLFLVGLRDLLLPARPAPSMTGGVPVTDADSRSWWSRVRTATGEQRLSDYYSALVESGRGARAYAIRHPLATVAALTAIGRLPKRVAVLGSGHDADAISRTLRRPGPLGTPFGVSGVSVLDVPADPEAYSLGAGKQTLRRKVRAAQRSGVTCRPVTDAGERAQLLALANHAETEHADAVYRTEAPNNSDLLDHDLWLAAFAADGRPLLLSVTPAHRAWAQLRYFRTLGAGPEFSDSRYLMTRVLVETLSGLGVRHLVEGTHPSELSNGLRHFQRMVGFRLTRVVSRRAPQASTVGVQDGAAEERRRAPVPLAAP